MLPRSVMQQWTLQINCGKIKQLEASSATPKVLHFFQSKFCNCNLIFAIEQNSTASGRKSTSSNKRRRTQSSSPRSPPVGAIVGVGTSSNDTLAKRCGIPFVRKIAQVIVPELISRIGNKWHGAHNKSIAANLLRYCVISDDVEVAETYDVLAGNNPRAEQSVVARILRSGQHAPILAADHPSIKELFSIYQGACTKRKKPEICFLLIPLFASGEASVGRLRLFETADNEESVLDNGNLNLEDEAEGLVMSDVE